MINPTQKLFQGLVGYDLKKKWERLLGLVWVDLKIILIQPGCCRSQPQQSCCLQPCPSSAAKVAKPAKVLPKPVLRC